MNDNVATLCLIAIGVGVLIVLAGGLLLAVLRGSVFGFGMMVMRMISEPPEEPTRVDTTDLPPATAENLRAKAQALDFDTAVAQQRMMKGQTQAAPPSEQQYFPDTSPIQPPDPRIQGFPPPRPKPPHDDEPLEHS